MSGSRYAPQGAGSSSIPIASVPSSRDIVSRKRMVKEKKEKKRRRRRKSRVSMKGRDGHWWNLPRPKHPPIPQLILPLHHQVSEKVKIAAPMSMHDPQRTLDAHTAMQLQSSLPPSPLWYPPCPPPHAELVAVKLEVAALEKQVLEYQQQVASAKDLQVKAEQELQTTTEDAECFRSRWQDAQLKVALVQKDAALEIGNLKKELGKKDSWLSSYRDGECRFKEQINSLKARVKHFDDGFCKHCECMQWEVEAEEREHQEDVGTLKAKLKETEEFLKTALAMYAPGLLQGFLKRQDETPIKLHYDET